LKKGTLYIAETSAIQRTSTQYRHPVKVLRFEDADRISETSAVPRSYTPFHRLEMGSFFALKMGRIRIAETSAMHPASAQK
jgi:hypothetical protein